MADRVGFEPTHDFHRLLRFQRNLLNHLSTYPFYLAPPLGLEPRQTVLETVVLPLTPFSHVILLLYHIILILSSVSRKIIIEDR